MKRVSRFVYFRVMCNCLDDFASSNGGRGGTWMGARGMIRVGGSTWCGRYVVQNVGVEA